MLFFDIEVGEKMLYYLSKEERDQLMTSLTESQRTFLNEHIKRGKRTAFARVMAREKGISITEDMTAEEIESHIDDWVLSDFNDAGNGYKTLDEPLKCECGKVLRYQYVVSNKHSGEVKKFGIIHFEEHMGFPPHVIKAIVDDFEAIDYELDDILTKIRNGWQLNLDLPDGFILGEDIIRFISMRLPLLDSQIDRLRRQVRQYYSKQKKQMIHEKKDPAYHVVSRARELKALETSLDDDFYESKSNIDERFVTIVNTLIHPGTISAEKIAVTLTERYGYSSRIRRGHYEVYNNVVVYLDSLVEQGKGIVLKKSTSDAVYKFS